MAEPSSPRLTVLVRSYRRPGALAELLGALRAQEHDSFEIVVVEQTPELTMEEIALLEPHFGDERVRVLRRMPLGGAGARNEGMRHARGDIVVMIDDDDLPCGRDFLSKHEAHYRRDPWLVGLSGRNVREEGEPSPYPDALRPIVRKLCFQYGPLGLPHLQVARFDEDVQPVEWLHGTNASIRREVALRAGLWDTTVRANDEHSFSFKLARVLRGREYLAFKAEPCIRRRLDVRGGMDKRYLDVKDYVENELRLAHRVVGRYRPLQFQLGYGLYLWSAFARTLAWVWDWEREHETTESRANATVRAAIELPAAARRVLMELHDSAAAHVPGPDVQSVTP